MSYFVDKIKRTTKKEYYIKIEH